MGNYDDIIDLPHHVSETHPPMSRADRAAQFSPFAALTGYDTAVRETARVTERRIELDEGVKAELNARLNCILEHLSEHPQVSITYFMPDEKSLPHRHRRRPKTGQLCQDPHPRRRDSCSHGGNGPCGGKPL